MVYFPSIDERLVTALAEQFPDQCPDLGQQGDEVWFKAGKASVVSWLRSKYEEHQDDALSLEVI